MIGLGFFDRKLEAILSLTKINNVCNLVIGLSKQLVERLDCFNPID